MNFDAFKPYMIEELRQNLPSSLSYHCLEHTLDVYSTAVYYAESEGVQGRQLILLQTAALLHDSGYLRQNDEHEKVSCNIAVSVLPEYGYTSHEIEEICGMIMATAVPQKPVGLLQEILCDADLDYLGRDDFFRISYLLYLEFKTAGRIKDEIHWDQLQVGFLNAHAYHTKSAIALRSEKKAEHLEQIKNNIQKRLI